MKELKRKIQAIFLLIVGIIMVVEGVNITFVLSRSITTGLVIVGLITSAIGYADLKSWR